MLGMVFREFVEMVEAEFGPEVADRILSLPELSSHGAYTRVGSYPHGDMVAMVVELGKAVDADPSALVKVFGKYLFGRFVITHDSIVSKFENGRQLLAGIESVIHTEVRRLYPDAKLPEFDCEDRDDGALIMDYSSTRPFADLAEGLIDGALTHFNESAVVERQEQPPEHPHGTRFIILWDAT